MDGFYVAKIKKLSDKIKGEPERKNENDKVAEDTTTDKIDATKSNDARNVLKGHKKKKKKKKKGKKRKSYVDKSDKHEEQKKNKISVPPPKIANSNAQGKKKNAKVTKPRRKKSEKAS